MALDGSESVLYHLVVCKYYELVIHLAVGSQFKRGQDCPHEAITRSDMFLTSKVFITEFKSLSFGLKQFFIGCLLKRPLLRCY
jgi:hypothetical protein